MPLRERIGVCFLLSAGIVVTIAGIVRTYFVYQGLVATYDETWYTYPLWICAAIEIHLAVVSHDISIQFPNQRATNANPADRSVLVFHQ